MTDPFKTLSLAKRPYLSEEEIGTAYRKLAGELHPDQAGGDANRFKELGEAAAILRDPARRLRALSGVEAGNIPPPEAADLFLKVAPLAKAVLAAPLKKLAATLGSLLGIVQGWHSSLDDRLNVMDASWPTHDPKEVAELADSFAYATRWESQLGERKLSLDCF